MANPRYINRSDIAKDWRSRGFSCGLWIDHAGRVWKDTTHETAELFMAIAGDLELEIAGERIRPSIGEEVLIPNGVSHTIRNIGGKTARWLYGQKREYSVALQPMEPIGDLNPSHL